MLSNLTSQLKEQGAEDRYYEVLEEVPKVRKGSWRTAACHTFFTDRNTGCV